MLVVSCTCNGRRWPDAISADLLWLPRVSAAFACRTARLIRTAVRLSVQMQSLYTMGSVHHHLPQLHCQEHSLSQVCAVQNGNSVWLVFGLQLHSMLQFLSSRFSHGL